MSRRSPKRKNDKSNPSGQVAKPPEGFEQPRLDDDTRVVFAEETNREDG